MKATAKGGDTRIRTFLDHEGGATAIEYALLAAFLAVAISATVWAIGGIVLNDLFQGILDAVTPTAE